MCVFGDGGVWVFLPERVCEIGRWTIDNGRWTIDNWAMKFSELAQYLQRLEGTASRNEMTVILAELFSKTSPEDARLVAYMTQGKLGPAYKSPDFGVADKQMLKALGEGADEVFKETGDLGKTAERLKIDNGQLTMDKAILSIREVYERLMEIAGAGGAGSQEKKQTLIAELVADLDAVGAKYAVKMILGKLRTGFSDMTVLDALSWMLVGNKSKKKEIESLYNVRADLGEVAQLVKNGQWTMGNGQFGPEVGTPVLMARAERASSAEEIWERLGECALEYKLDGLRIQAHIGQWTMGNGQLTVKLFSRGLEDVTSMYPDVVEGLAVQIKHEAIVEGEMIAVGKDERFLPFQETAQRKRKYNIAEMADKIPLRIYLFDVLMADKTDMTNKTNKERREALESLVVIDSHLSSSVVRLMTRKIAKKASDIDEFFEKAIEAGTEGIVAKNLNGPYAAGARDFNWIKYKKSYDKSSLNDTIDAVVMGYDVGQGKRAKFGIGDFLIGVYNPATDKYLTVAKIGTGLTDEEWREMKLRIDDGQLTVKPESYEVDKVMNVDVWCRPKIVVEIKADEISRSPMHTAGYALRFPRLVSWREKKPEDATTAKEITRLFEMQKK